MGLSYRSNLYLTYIIGFVVFIFVVNWAFDGVDRVRSLTPAIKRPSHDAKWLLGIELPPQKVLRRATIRSTWATSTRGLGIPYEYKFIIGGYKHLPWAPIIDAEIAAHNDILVLEDFIPDDKETANHLKFIALCDHLAKQEQETGKRYEFVSKVDDDVWFNIPPFYDHFIAPRLPGGPKYRSEGITVIGRPFNWGGNRGFIYTSGRMYTVNWPHVKIMGAEYAADPTFDYETLSLAEDMLPEVRS